MRLPEDSRPNLNRTDPMYRISTLPTTFITKTEAELIENCTKTSGIRVARHRNLTFQVDISRDVPVLTDRRSLRAISFAY